MNVFLTMDGKDGEETMEGKGGKETVLRALRGPTNQPTNQPTRDALQTKKDRGQPKQRA